MTGVIPSFEIRMVSAVEAHTRASSSAAMAWVTVSAPAPPYASGMPRAGSSISLQASNDFHGNSAFRSASAALGATFSSAKVRMVSRKSRWTSVRSKFGVLTRSLSQTVAAPPRRLLRWPRDAATSSAESLSGANSGIQ